VIDSDPRTVFKPLTAIIPLAAIIELVEYVLTPDAVCVDVPAIADVPLKVRAPDDEVALEALIALCTLRVTSTPLDVAEVAGIAVLVSLTL
tara:strand:- start:1723 stop:1995 length:273 start_codon:yes stop_codon:yes gene_type:complete